MLKKLLGAAAMAAVAFAAAPASAAKMAGCSGENLEKASTEAMADGAGKIAAQNEVAQAQEAQLGGKIGAWMHLSRAMHAGAMNQASYGGEMNQAPAETTTKPRTKPGKRADCLANRPFRPQDLKQTSWRAGELARKMRI